MIYLQLKREKNILKIFKWTIFKKKNHQLSLNYWGKFHCSLILEQFYKRQIEIAECQKRTKNDCDDIAFSESKSSLEMEMMPFS